MLSFHLIRWSLDNFVLICIAYKEAYYLNTHASVFAAGVGDDNCACVWSFSYYSAEDNDAMNSGDLNGHSENELNGKPENENLSVNSWILLVFSEVWFCKCILALALVLNSSRQHSIQGSGEWTFYVVCLSYVNLYFKF